MHLWLFAGAALYFLRPLPCPCGAELAWPQRKQNSAQAWHEWIPIRDTDTNLYAINRTIGFGEALLAARALMSGSLPCSWIALEAESVPWEV